MPRDFGVRDAAGKGDAVGDAVETGLGFEPGFAGTVADDESADGQVAEFGERAEQIPAVADLQARAEDEGPHDADDEVVAEAEARAQGGELGGRGDGRGR